MLSRPRHIGATPGTQSGRHQRDLSSRSLNVRGVWDREVDAWMNVDFDEVDAVRGIAIEDLGPECDAYSYVSSAGWPA
ncbi:hypothetical protein AB0D68_32250 [Streptomyces sp. NPDC048212]|uniref:hypothetical protein n=1 Tax=unclassified Streptomyces TaxID=2593676 RepID=UPI003400BBDB